MKTIALVVAAAIFSTATFAAHAGRTGDQWLLQEEQNKRVIAERQKLADMRTMMEECLKMQKSN